MKMFYIEIFLLYILHFNELVLTTYYLSLITYYLLLIISYINVGAQWLSGRVLDSRPKGRGFEPHRRHCVVVLEQDTFILA